MRAIVKQRIKEVAMGILALGILAAIVIPQFMSAVADHEKNSGDPNFVSVVCDSCGSPIAKL